METCEPDTGAAGEAPAVDVGFAADVAPVPATTVGRATRPGKLLQARLPSTTAKITTARPPRIRAQRGTTGRRVARRGSGGRSVGATPGAASVFAGSFM